MSKWISEASKRVLPNHVGLDKAREMATNGFRCYKIKFFGPCMAREMPNISFGCRFWRASNPKRRKSRHGTAPPRLQKYAKTCGFRNIFEKKRKQCTLDNTEMQKNAHKRVVLDEFWDTDATRRLPKAVWTHKSAQEKPKLEVWEPGNTHRIRVHMQKNARKRVVFAMFYKNRIKAS